MKIKNTFHLYDLIVLVFLAMLFFALPSIDQTFASVDSKHNKQLFVFDFDQTITKNHTFKSTYKNGVVDLKTIKDNLKPGIKEALQSILSQGQLLGIATFHTRRDVIEDYLNEIFDYNHVWLSQVKIVVRDEIKFTANLGKNPYILEIVELFQNDSSFAPLSIIGLSFFDDSASNIMSFPRVCKEIFTDPNKHCKAYLVDKNPESDLYSLKTLKLLKKFSP